MRASCLMLFVLVTQSVFGADDPTFAVDDSMLRIAWYEDGVLGLGLDESATSEFEAFSATHTGKPVVVSWNGRVLSRFTVYDVITSGRLRVNDPSEELIRLVEAFEHRASPEQP